jgi:hypothetical protein
MPHLFRKRLMRHAALTLLAAASLTASHALAQDGEDLRQGFVNPPPGARPRVWWHWMNGNITKAGIKKDIDWMSSVGLGGLQNFDAALATPQVVDKRLAYMTPDWADAFHFAVDQANARQMEFGIAASPGWSETGGPWVKPEDGMKKVVWSRTSVTGGKPLSLHLTDLPGVTGPYQAMPVQPDIMGEVPDPKTTPQASGAIAVFAYPDTVQALPLPDVSIAGKTLDARTLQLPDGAVELPPAANDQPSVIRIDYAAPQTVRALSLFFPGAATLFDAAAFTPVLEASLDGQSWHKVTELTLTAAPTTASFAPVTAAHFRLVLQKSATAINPAFIPMPGVDMGPFSGFGKPAPIRLGLLKLSADPRINQFEAKAGLVQVNDYYALDQGLNPTEQGVPAASVIDLTSRVSPDGTLTWTPPEGRWTIVRLGWSLTGITNHPATAEATGLEVDKYDASAVRAYLETYLGQYQNHVAPDIIGPNGVKAMVTDSTEVGPSNWTPDMIHQFKRLRGYDPTPWLPALSGVIIGDRAQSDAFLYDYRRTLADLMASAHYGTVAEVAHEHGLTLYGEALESSRVTLGDDMTMRSHTDVPMSAMWSYREQYGPDPAAIADMKGAASVAHIYGQNLTAAESLTSAFAPWAFAPADLQTMIDMEFVSGINRPVIHTSVHQPLGDDKKPGLSLAIFGQYFNRNETWAGMARPWVDYIARSAYLLQQGRNVADIGYIYGEEAPLVTLYHTHVPADAPIHYAYDFVSADALTDQLSVDNGEVVSKGGARYKALYLGGTSAHMTLPTLKKLADLAQQGATLIGKAPISDPSLADDPSVFSNLVAKLWGGGEVTQVGAGRVIASDKLEDALAQTGVTPDFIYDGSDAQILFLHRALADGDLYFLTNRSNADARTEARFRVTGKTPELWHADTGKSEPVSYRIEDNDTLVTLDLPARGSVFVVFEKPASAPSLNVAPKGVQQVAELAGPWSVTFDGLGAPSPITADKLGSLTQSDTPAVKYFSGVIVYEQHLQMPKGQKAGAPLLIDLGKVGDVAEVRVNGQSAGIAWKAPYRLDIGALMKKGDNDLEVRVADLWVNRLIGDAQPGASKVTFTAVPTYTKDAPLRPSGLMGPVTLLRPDPQ